MNETPWKIQNNMQRFSWTGKLVSFKTLDIKEAIKSRFKELTGNKHNVLSHNLPDVLLVLGYETETNTRTGHTTGNILFLADEKTVYFYLPTQFCTSEQTVEAVIEMFFKEAR